MQRREWHDLPRHRDLPAGPWDNEPDKVQWPSDTGLACMIRRGPMGNWCGYVGLDETHPLHGKSYSDDDLPDLDVHGGLTYAAPCDGNENEGICHVPDPGEPDALWWLGFDCGHAWDLIPSMLKIEELTDVNPYLRDVYQAAMDPSEQNVTYKPVAFVTAETERLATQLAAIR